MGSYSSIPPLSLTNRGYTGHEHLPAFNIINMNGRVYDPVVGQYLNTDNTLNFQPSLKNNNSNTKNKQHTQ